MSSQPFNVKVFSAVALIATCLTAQSADSEKALLSIQNAIQRGDLPTASRMIAGALEKHPNDPGVINLRGVVHAQHGEIHAAHLDFARAVRLNPGLMPAWQNLGRACQMETQIAASCAVDAWQRVLHFKADDAEARDSLESLKLVKDVGSEAGAQLPDLQRLALAYEQLQRPADARKTLERVAVLDPGNTAHLFELARLAEAVKDHEGALGYLAHARDLAPREAQIHFLFAMVAREMDLPIEARKSLDQALALDPENPDYNYAMGSVILTTRDAATAVSYFQKFVKARPADPRGHFALGIANFTAGDYAKAKEEMAAAAGDAKTASGAEYFLGRIARLEDDLPGAIGHLRKSIGLNPVFSESHTELARVEMQSGSLEDARAELGRALKLDAASFQANSQLLVLYRRTHDPRAESQAEILKKLDEERSRRAELMLRTVEFKP